MEEDQKHAQMNEEKWDKWAETHDGEAGYRDD
jgi:hypothetical protein